MSRVTDALRRNSFVVFGRAGMDLWADPIGVRSTEAQTFRSGLGGSAANIAVGLVKLGGTADLVTSVSDDAVGRFCVNQLTQYGVGTKHVRFVGGEFRTSLAIYESVVADFQNVIYRNGAADFEVTEADARAVDYADYGAFITTGTAFAAEPSRSAAFAAIEKARAAGLPIIFDVDYRPYSWPSPAVAADVLSRAGEASDVIIGNDEEFDFMAGSPGQGRTKAASLASPDRIIVYKMGGEGAVTFADGKEIATGIYPVEPVKPNGAGDSFMAGLLSGAAEPRMTDASMSMPSATP
ncbi:MAG: PfkB family carbohydrate kinase, partial [Pseudomonadota bacterium]